MRYRASWSRPIRFAVTHQDQVASFEVLFTDGGSRYPQREGPRTTITVAGKEKPLAEYFAGDAPHIDFGDGSLLIHSHLYALPEKRALPPYRLDHIDVWNWTGVNIRKESQGTAKDQDSIQRRVIEMLAVCRRSLRHHLR